MWSEAETLKASPSRNPMATESQPPGLVQCDQEELCPVT